MNIASSSSSTIDTLRALNEQIQRFERARRGNVATDRISSGYLELDRWLPDRGLSRGILVEWLASQRGSGAVTLALTTARQACAHDRSLIVVDRTNSFYPPAALGLGIDNARLVLVRPDNDEDEAWAVDQSLRCEGVGAVLCWPQRLDDHTFRRWQLAAESSGAIGLLIRSEQARREPTWADVRLLVTPRPSASAWRVGLTALRCRGASALPDIELELDAAFQEKDSESCHEPYRMPLAPSLAAAATGFGSPRAERPASGAV